MIYILASIVVCCAFLCAVDLIVMVWEAAERRAERKRRRYRNGF